MATKETDYQLLFTSMHYGLAVHDVICNEKGLPVDYRFITVNPAFEKLTGLKAKEIVGKTVLEVLPNTESYWIEQFGNVAITGETKHFENYSQELESYYRVTAYSPQKNQFAVIFDNITEEKKMNLALSKSEERFRNLFEQSLDGIVYTDDQGLFVTFNESFQKMLGYSKEELSKLSFYDITPKKWHEWEKREIFEKLILKQGYSGLFEKEYIHKDGTVFPVELSAFSILDEKRQPKYLWAIVRDITVQKKAKKELHYHQMVLQNVLDHMAAGVFMIEAPNGKPVLTNKMAEKLLGKGISPDATGDDLNRVYAAYKSGTDTLYPPEEMPIVRGLSGEEKTINDMEIHKADGTVVQIEVAGSPVYNEDGEIFGSVAVFYDITERKKIEEELKQYRENLEGLINERTKELKKINSKLQNEIEERKDAENRIHSLLYDKELLLKEVHHRIKNNMNTISHLLKLHAGLIEEATAKEALEDASNRVTTMMRIYDKLYKSGNYHNIKIQHYLTDLTNEIKKSYVSTRDNISIEVNIADITIEARHSYPLGIIANEIITNAVKYAFPDGIAGSISVNLTRINNTIEFSISDNGIGLSKDIDIYSTAHFGLFLINTLVDQLDGRLTLSKEGGTKYIIQFEI